MAWYIFIPAQNPFPHSFPFMRGFSLQWTATFEMSWNPTRAYFWFWHITILVTLKTPKSTYQQQTLDAKTQGLGRNQQIRELSSDVGLQGSQGAPASAGETPGPSSWSHASMTSGGPGEPSKCCGCNTLAVQIEGVVGMPCQRVFLFVVDDLTTKKLGISNYIVDVVRNCI